MPSIGGTLFSDYHTTSQKTLEQQITQSWTIDFRTATALPTLSINIIHAAPVEIIGNLRSQPLLQ
jgi:hypothetical protein